MKTRANKPTYHNWSLKLIFVSLIRLKRGLGGDKTARIVREILRVRGRLWWYPMYHSHRYERRVTTIYYNNYLYWRYERYDPERAARPRPNTVPQFGASWLAGHTQRFYPRYHGIRCSKFQARSRDVSTYKYIRPVTYACSNTDTQFPNPLSLFFFGAFRFFLVVPRAGSNADSSKLVPRPAPCRCALPSTLEGPYPAFFRSWRANGRKYDRVSSAVVHNVMPTTGDVPLPPGAGQETKRY